MKGRNEGCIGDRMGGKNEDKKKVRKAMRERDGKRERESKIKNNGLMDV